MHSFYFYFCFFDTCMDRFETCWPAFSKDIHGVVIVVESEKMMELERWYVDRIGHNDNKKKVQLCCSVVSGSVVVASFLYPLFYWFAVYHL